MFSEVADEIGFSFDARDALSHAFDELGRFSYCQLSRQTYRTS